MWIRERFFATLKKVEQKAFRLFVLWFTVLLTGCVVTDKITFEEAVNQPLALLEAKPDTPLLTKSGDKDITFELVVMDPDIYDPDDRELDARLTYSTDYWDEDRIECGNFITPLQGEEDIYKADGIPFRVICTLNLRDKKRINNTMVSVTMTVSDLGFQANGNPRRNAHLVVHNWAIQLIPEI